MMKRAVLVAAALVLLSVPGAFAQSDLRFGVRAGSYFDPTDLFVGLEVVYPITSNFVFNPNFEAVFADDGANDDTTLGLNADLAYNFAMGGNTRAWAGAGLAGFLEDDEFEGGVNLLAGVGFTAGTLDPYAQAKLVFADDDNRAAIGLGVRF